MQLSARFFALLALGAFAHPCFAQGSWVNLGSGKTGTNGVPFLKGTPPQVGKSVDLTITNARAKSALVYMLGTSRIDLPVYGGVWIPFPEFTIPVFTDANGAHRLQLAIPNDPKLLAVVAYAQALVVDPRATFTVAFTNALRDDLCSRYETVENFTSSLFLDGGRSAGTWGGGTVQFSDIGGSGIHGDFDPAYGKLVNTTGTKKYEWDLSKASGIKIPKERTLSGKDEFVTNGRFSFSRLELPANTDVQFVGSTAARLNVSGNAFVLGGLAANGESLPPAGRGGKLQKSAALGEKGGRGGAMGGAGGDGADRGDGVSNKPAFNGRPGKDVSLVAGHAYARRWAGSGGPGSPQFPANGKSSSIVYSYFGVIAQHANRGGGGGGFVTTGGAGTANWTGRNSGNKKYLSTGTTPGGKGNAFPRAFPGYTNGLTHQDHYIAGGAGGGGGGSAPGGAIKSVATDRFKIGRAGGGAGGALALRIGKSLWVGVGGRIEARGGAGAVDMANFSTRGMMTPGGGGSGGAVFLQVNHDTNNLGAVNVLGGAGGITQGLVNDQVYSGMLAKGGAGGQGILHFETSRPTAGYKVGLTLPNNPPVQKLDPKERDPLVTVRSKWYPTSLLFAPNYLRYEIEATVDGKPVVYSDDPKVGNLAQGTGIPLHFVAQGAILEYGPTGALRPRPGTKPTLFTPYVGPFTGGTTLFQSGSTGFRFALTLDRSVGKRVVVKKVTVVWCL